MISSALVTAFRYEKFYRIALRSKRNIAKTAVARELACFIWGMMTEHYA